MSSRKIAAGNWKMNGLVGQLGEVTSLAASHPKPVSEVVLCPPATLLTRMADAVKGGAIAVGAAPDKDPKPS